MSALNKLNHFEYFLNYWYSLRTSKLHKITRVELPRDPVFLCLYLCDSPGFLVLPFEEQKELSNTILGSYEILIKTLVASVELLNLILIARFFLPCHRLKLPGQWDKSGRSSKCIITMLMPFEPTLNELSPYAGEEVLMVTKKSWVNDQYNLVQFDGRVNTRH